MILGADISQWQGDPDFRKLGEWLDRPDQHALEFFMLRTEDGLYKDAKFDAYCNGLNRLGFYDLGTYFFFRAHLPIREQVLRAVAMHGDLPGPLAVDVETLDNVSPELVADAALETLENIHSMTGRRPMLYTDLGDWSKLSGYGAREAFAEYPLWLAAVTGDPEKKTAVPLPWHEPVMMRQYTFSRQVPGFSGNVDGDVFFGDIQGWRDAGR